jgi:hypothetical protein
MRLWQGKRGVMAWLCRAITPQKGAFEGLCPSSSPALRVPCWIAAASGQQARECGTI